jgi:hypothetical protein
MSPFRKNAWLGVTGFFLLLVGFMLGARSQSAAANDAFTEKMNDSAELFGAKNELTVLKIQKTALEKRAQTCEANFSTFTVLYEPAAAPSVGILHGFVDVQVPGLAGPAHPAWIIPAKIEPRVIALQPGLVYGYIDRDTKQIDGPYPPVAIANGDKMSVAGWAAR